MIQNESPFERGHQKTSRSQRFSSLLEGTEIPTTEVKTADEINLFKVLIQNGKYKNNKIAERNLYSIGILVLMI